MKLTQARILSLACPAGKKDMLVFDDDQRGLAVRVTATGAKSFTFQFTIDGTKRRLPIGAFGQISLAQARDAARVFAGQVAMGVDPAAERQRTVADKKRRKAEAQSQISFGELIDQWAKLHLSNRRPTYREAAERVSRSVFAGILDLPAASVDKAMVVPVIDRLTASDRPAMAKAAVAYGRACYGWAIKRGTVSGNPFDGIPTTTSRARERKLSDDELAAVWQATEGPDPYNRIVRALMLTAQRKQEVAGMAWSEIDGDVWVIPGARAKNGNPHAVPLSPPVLEVIHSAPRRNELVFPGERGVRSGWNRAKKNLDSRSGVTGWTLHDLRRTAASGMQRLGVRFEIIEHVLNHLSGSRGGLGAIYQQFTFEEEKREALERWAEHVLRIAQK